jgi:Fe-S cluster biogenesis protein NfuA
MSADETAWEQAKRVAAAMKRAAQKHRAPVIMSQGGKVYISNFTELKSDMKDKT